MQREMIEKFGPIESSELYNIKILFCAINALSVSTMIPVTYYGLYLLLLYT